MDKNIRDVDKKVPDVSGLVTTTVLNTKISEVENKIQDTSSLVITTFFNTKTGEVENKIPYYNRYISAQEINKLTTGNFKERLKQADLIKKNDFDNKLVRFNKKIT